VKIAFYGSSLLSSYWNGAATYYRGLLHALAALGHEITFFEPDAFDRQAHRDIPVPGWCRVCVYPANAPALRRAIRAARDADVVVKASGVGYEDDALLEGVMASAAPEAIRIFLDVDAPATLATVAAAPDHPLRRALGQLDLVLTYGGGDPVVEAYRGLGARACVPIYNALDPDTHFPVEPEPRFDADLGFLGNRLPDREARVHAFLFDGAARCPDARFLLGGSGWEPQAVPANVRLLGHVPTTDHNAFNATPRAVLNVTRADMAANGFSPATRVFEAAGAGACLATDPWRGIELFLAPDREVLVVRDGADIAEMLRTLTPGRAHEIGAAARARVLSEHTYDRRAVQLDGLLSEARALRAGVGAVA
jgi:spore maturation protein CgeB